MGYVPERGHIAHFEPIMQFKWTGLCDVDIWGGYPRDFAFHYVIAGHFTALEDRRLAIFKMKNDILQILDILLII